MVLVRSKAVGRVEVVVVDEVKECTQVTCVVD
jgi:hypothetical protein